MWLLPWHTLWVSLHLRALGWRPLGSLMHPLPLLAFSHPVALSCRILSKTFLQPVMSNLGRILPSHQAATMVQGDKVRMYSDDQLEFASFQSAASVYNKSSFSKIAIKGTVTCSCPADDVPLHRSQQKEQHFTYTNPFTLNSVDSPAHSFETKLYLRNKTKIYLSTVPQRCTI